MHHYLITTNSTAMNHWYSINSLPHKQLFCCHCLSVVCKNIGGISFRFGHQLLELCGNFGTYLLPFQIVELLIQYIEYNRPFFDVLRFGRNDVHVRMYSLQFPSHKLIVGIIAFLKALAASLRSLSRNRVKTWPKLQKSKKAKRQKSKMADLWTNKQFDLVSSMTDLYFW